MIIEIMWFIEKWKFKITIFYGPLVMTNIAIENDHRHSEFPLEHGGSLHRCINVDQRVFIDATDSCG